MQTQCAVCQSTIILSFDKIGLNKTYCIVSSNEIEFSKRGENSGGISG